MLARRPPGHAVIEHEVVRWEQDSQPRGGPSYNERDRMRESWKSSGLFIKCYEILMES